MKINENSNSYSYSTLYTSEYTKLNNNNNKKKSINCLKCSRANTITTTTTNSINFSVYTNESSQFITTATATTRRTSRVADAERLKYLNLVSWYQGLRNEENWMKLRKNMDDDQTNLFINWINDKLENTIYRSFRLNDLYIDLSDGLRILYLLEILYNTILIKEKFNTKLHKIKNFQTCINFMETERKVKCVGINSIDLADGNRKILLGLLFLIKHDYEYTFLKESLEIIKNDILNTKEINVNQNLDELKKLEKKLEEKKENSLPKLETTNLEKQKPLSGSKSDFLPFENSFGYQLADNFITNGKICDEAPTIDSKNINSRNVQRNSQEYTLINDLVRKNSKIDELYNLHVKSNKRNSLVQQDSINKNDENRKSAGCLDPQQNYNEDLNDSSVSLSSTSSNRISNKDHFGSDQSNISFGRERNAMSDLSRHSNGSNVELTKSFNNSNSSINELNELNKEDKVNKVENLVNNNNNIIESIRNSRSEESQPDSLEEMVEIFKKESQALSPNRECNIPIFLTNQTGQDYQWDRLNDFDNFVPFQNENCLINNNEKSVQPTENIYFSNSSDTSDNSNELFISEPISPAKSNNLNSVSNNDSNQNDYDMANDDDHLSVTSEISECENPLFIDETSDLVIVENLTNQQQNQRAELSDINGKELESNLLIVEEKIENNNEAENKIVEALIGELDEKKSDSFFEKSDELDKYFSSSDYEIVSNESFDKYDNQEINNQDRQKEDVADDFFQKADELDNMFDNEEDNKVLETTVIESTIEIDEEPECLFQKTDELENIFSNDSFENKINDENECCEQDQNSQNKVDFINDSNLNDLKNSSEEPLENGLDKSFSSDNHEQELDLKTNEPNALDIDTSNINQDESNKHLIVDQIEFPKNQNDDFDQVEIQDSKVEGNIKDEKPTELLNENDLLTPEGNEVLTDKKEEPSVEFNDFKQDTIENDISEPDQNDVIETENINQEELVYEMNDIQDNLNKISNDCAVELNKINDSFESEEKVNFTEDNSELNDKESIDEIQSNELLEKDPITEEEKRISEDENDIEVTSNVNENEINETILNEIIDSPFSQIITDQIEILKEKFENSLLENFTNNNEKFFEDHNITSEIKSENQNDNITEIENNINQDLKEPDHVNMEKSLYEEMQQTQEKIDPVDFENTNSDEPEYVNNNDTIESKSSNDINKETYSNIVAKGLPLTNKKKIDSVKPHQTISAPEEFKPTTTNKPKNKNANKKKVDFKQQEQKPTTVPVVENLADKEIEPVQVNAQNHSNDIKETTKNQNSKKTKQTTGKKQVQKLEPEKKNSSLNSNPKNSEKTEITKQVTDDKQSRKQKPVEKKNETEINNKKSGFLNGLYRYYKYYFWSLFILAISLILYYWTINENDSLSLNK